MTKYTPHPVADLFPMLDNEQLGELAADIEENGQIHPILVQGTKIIDGRNRYAACKNAGIEPVVEEWDGSDVKSFIISTNIHRRHLNKGQRAMLLMNIHHPDGDVPVGQKGPPEEGLSEFSKASLQRAAYILREMPDYATPVIAGETDLTSAYNEVNKIIQSRKTYDERRDKILEKSKELLKEADELLKSKKGLKFINPVALPALDPDDIDGEGGDAIDAALEHGIKATERGLEVYKDLMAWENDIMKLARNVPAVPVLKGDEALTIATIKIIESVIESLRLEGVNITNRLHEQHLALGAKKLKVVG